MLRMDWSIYVAERVFLIANNVIYTAVN